MGPGTQIDFPYRRGPRPQPRRLADDLGEPASFHLVLTASSDDAAIDAGTDPRSSGRDV